MGVSILVRTSEHRGDHAADVAVALEPVPGETVEELLFRAERTVTKIDVIELRRTR